MITKNKTGKKSTVPSYAIFIDKVFKSFKKTKALKGVSISIAPGEIYGLLGRNGAGKTTLVKILLDITRPSSGTTYLLNKSSRSSASRRSVGYLPEDHRFPEYQTGYRALAFYSALSGHSKFQGKKRIKKLLELVELGFAGRRKIRTYSKGMKQRLGLAQALVNDPQILFLDEPTDGVDPVGRAKIRDILLRLKADGKTIFLNSHLLSEIEQVCDRVGILNEGRLVREGTIEELTRVEKAYTITTFPAPDTYLIESLKEKVVEAKLLNGGIEVKISSVNDIDTVVDFLRSRGLSIRSLNLARLSLEDVFLGSVNSDTIEGRQPGKTGENRKQQESWKQGESGKTRESRGSSGKGEME